MAGEFIAGALQVDMGSTNVGTAGTPVALSSDGGHNAADRIYWARFKPASANSGSCFVGLSNVSSTHGWSIRAPAAGREDDQLELPIPPGGSVRLGDIFFDVATDNEDVDWAILYSAGG